MTWLKPKESWMTIIDGGAKTWKNKKGQLHRRNGPAVEWVGGMKSWYINGKWIKNND